GLEALRSPADVDPLIASIKARPPDLVFFAGRHAQVAPFWKRAHEQGVKARLLGSDGLDSPEFARAAGAAAVGASYTATFRTAPRPWARRRRYRALDPSWRTSRRDSAGRHGPTRPKPMTRPRSRSRRSRAPCGAMLPAATPWSAPSARRSTRASPGRSSSTA